MSDFFRVQFLEHFNAFINQLKVIFPSEDVQQQLTQFTELSDDDKVSRGTQFTNSITGDNTDLFAKHKIKVFSHKSPDTQAISESLFGKDFCIKNLLNNQPDEVKKIIWSNLHTICMVSELLKPKEEQDNDKVKKLSVELYKNNNPFNDSDPTKPKKRLEEMLGVNVNDETTVMIDDIVKSFEDILAGSNKNPLMGIMEISQKISVKYADKINSGEIELDKIIQSITSKVPGMDKMMSSMEGMESMGDIQGMMSKMFGGGDSKKPKEKVIIDENFSTADVEVGVNKEEESKFSNFKIGSALKVADQFGILPGGQSSGEGGLGGLLSGGMPDLSKMMGGEMPDLSNLMGGEGKMPDLGKMFDLIGKMSNSEVDPEAMKAEMENFLGNDMGIDLNKLTQQFEGVTQTCEDLNKASENLKETFNNLSNKDS